MSDCSKTAVFLRERRRMCDTHTECQYCDIGKHRVFGDTCRDFCVENTELAISIVQKWSDEHSLLPKTYADVFFEQHPFADAELVKGIPSPWVCRARIYGGNKCSVGETKNCFDCWHEPYPEQKGDDGS